MATTSGLTQLIRELFAADPAQVIHPGYATHGWVQYAGGLGAQYRASAPVLVSCGSARYLFQIIERVPILPLFRVAAAGGSPLGVVYAPAGPAWVGFQPLNPVLALSQGPMSVDELGALLSNVSGAGRTDTAARLSEGYAAAKLALVGRIEARHNQEGHSFRVVGFEDPTDPGVDAQNLHVFTENTRVDDATLVGHQGALERALMWEPYLDARPWEPAFGPVRVLYYGPRPFGGGYEQALAGVVADVQMLVRGLGLVVGARAAEARARQRVVPPDYNQHDLLIAGTAAALRANATALLEYVTEHARGDGAASAVATAQAQAMAIEVLAKAISDQVRWPERLTAALMAYRLDPAAFDALPGYNVHTGGVRAVGWCVV